MQRLHIDPIKWAQPGKGTPGQPYFGTMGNANFAGGYIGLTSPWLYYAFLKNKEIWKKALIVAWGVLELAALWFTSARNGIIALGAAIAVIGFLHIRRAPRVIKILAAIGTAVVVIPAVLLAFLVVVHPGSKKPPPALRKVDILRSETIRVRGYWWLAGLKMFEHRPITGWGPDSFVTHYQQYLDRGAAGLGDAETADKPHNVFVEHAANTGLLGLIAYLGLLVVAFRRALRRLRDGPPTERVLATTLIGLLAAYAGQAFFSIDVSAIAVLGWILLGAIAAFADPPEVEAPVITTPRRSPVLAGVAILLAVLLATLSNAPLKADHEARTAGRVAKDGTMDEVLGYYDLAMHWDPFEPEYPGFAGDYLERTANNESDKLTKRDLLKRAIAYYRKMNALQPGYGLWKQVLGNAESELAAVGGGTFQRAQTTLREARRLSPYDWRVVKAQSDLYTKWAVANSGTPAAKTYLCEAYGYAKESVALRRSRGETQLALGGALARLGHLEEAREPLKRAIRHDSTAAAGNNLLDTVEKLLAGPKAKRPPFVRCG
jgi:tetratricopeptide (TPR) repeat protein